MRDVTIESSLRWLRDVYVAGSTVNSFQCLLYDKNQSCLAQTTKAEFKGFSLTLRILHNRRYTTRSNPPPQSPIEKGKRIPVHKPSLP